MEKKKPMRTCIACRTEKPKIELIRVVKFGDQITLDKTGKANGRGAYVCNNKECIEKLKKQKMLNRAFSCQVADEIYDKIMEDFLGDEK
ncbi:MAG: YlxR family protein [Clostridia bacterium]|nr:YlxR family protein [Clostridia bacterium]